MIFGLALVLVYYNKKNKHQLQTVSFIVYNMDCVSISFKRSVYHSRHHSSKQGVMKRHVHIMVLAWHA